MVDYTALTIGSDTSLTSANAVGTYQTPFETQLAALDAQNAAYVSTEDALSSLTASGQTASAKVATAVAPAANLIRRQYEVNEWTTNNRLDTLFVLQMTFIGICVCAILAGLYRMHVVGGGFFGFVSFFVLVILIFIIIRRAQYTRYTRDQRYWNRQTFDKAPPPPVTLPTITCTST